MSSTIATIVRNTINVQSIEVLPDGDTCATLACDDYEMYRTLPPLLALANGVRVARTGWNSDKLVAYYKSSHWAVARVASLV
jgi:hypothetical protein